MKFVLFVCIFVFCFKNAIGLKLYCVDIYGHKRGLIGYISNYDKIRVSFIDKENNFYVKFENNIKYKNFYAIESEYSQIPSEPDFLQKHCEALKMECARLNNSSNDVFYIMGKSNSFKAKMHPIIFHKKTSSFKELYMCPNQEFPLGWNMIPGFSMRKSDKTEYIEINEVRVYKN